MILQVDAGNSRVHWRCLDDNRVVMARGDQSWETVDVRGLDRVEPRSLTGLEFASVAGRKGEELKAALVAGMAVPQLREMVVEKRQCGVVNAYEAPASMGVDRWLAMIGAFRRLGGPLTVLDAGSAITIDHVDVDGVHHGGYILAGLRMMEDALGAGTSRVRAVSAAGTSVAPGTTTSECVHHGMAWLLQTLALSAAAYWNHEGHLVVTGGDVARIPEGGGISLVREPDLVFLGMDAVVSDNSAGG